MLLFQPDGALRLHCLRQCHAFSTFGEWPQVPYPAGHLNTAQKTLVPQRAVASASNIPYWPLLPAALTTGPMRRPGPEPGSGPGRNDSASSQPLAWLHMVDTSFQKKRPAAQRRAGPGHKAGPSPKPKFKTQTSIQAPNPDRRHNTSNATRFLPQVSLP